MEGISEKNTKAEILKAYAELEAEVLELKHQMEAAASESDQGQKGVTEEDLLKIESLVNEKDRLLEVIQDMNDQKVTVVIPYVGEFAQGIELQLALRGWYQNFKENFNVVIIGSGIPQLSEAVHVIECERIGKNPPIDIAHKMLKAIESDMVSERFIWANDDQYLISPCMLADLEILKCSGKLGETSFGSSTYQENKKRTYEALQAIGVGTWDFSTHTPFVFEKEKLKDIITVFDCQKVPYLIATLYFNAVFPGFVPLQVDGQTALDHDNIKIGVYRQGADFERLKKLMPGKKLINNSQSGWSKKLEEILIKRFPEKCPFEL